MHRFLRLGRLALIVALIGIALAAITVGVTYWLMAPRLPSVATLKQVDMQLPLRVLSSDGKLIATFGETRRIPVRSEDVPDNLRDAVLSAEDASFYEHPGFDWRGIMRAAWHVIASGGDKSQGGSTITQQVAKRFFLSPEKLYTRKVMELFIALRMEKLLSKDEILTLYLNKMFMGHRAYGVAAAAEYYYGKTLHELSLAQCAMLASLFQLPSTVNPVTDRARSIDRRNWVLGQMLSNGFITETEYEHAVAEADLAFPHEPPVEVNAPYVAEMVRLEAIDRFGNAALTDGYVVTTTIDSQRQRMARHAVRKQMISYDHRHGYRGPLEHVDPDKITDLAAYEKILADHPEIAGMVPGLVTSADAESALVFLKSGETVLLDLSAMAWARPYLSENSMGPKPDSVTDVVAAGDVIRVARNAEGAWELAQIPAAQAALVSLDPLDGSLEALVGGYSFLLSKFNRATMSTRQPGSSFKPFLYSAALEHGFSTASIVNDAPLVVPDPTAPNGQWTPSNDDGSFDGPIRVRTALYKSKNLVSVRLLDAIGIRYFRDYATRFGFSLDAMPKSLSLALGTASVSPMDMARGFSVFANGGFLVDPYFIERIETRDAETVYLASPLHSCVDCPFNGSLATVAQEPAPNPLAALSPIASAQAGDQIASPKAPRVISPDNVFLMNSMLEDVIRRGTGRRAMVLDRRDLAGKTGTTNDHRDAWFSGFNPTLVTSVWVGFDDYSSLGRGEFGSQAALPIWIDYMGAALEGSDEVSLPRPDDIVTATIDANSGLIVPKGDPDAITEFFSEEEYQRLKARSPAISEQPREEHAYDIF